MIRHLASDICLPFTIPHNYYSSEDSELSCSGDDYENNLKFNVTDVEAIESTELSSTVIVFSIVDNYDIKENIFFSNKIMELRTREKALFDRNQKGYYPCKVHYKQLYINITNAYAHFIGKPMLWMLKWGKYTTERGVKQQCVRL